MVELFGPRKQCVIICNNYSCVNYSAALHSILPDRDYPSDYHPLFLGLFSSATHTRLRVQ